MIKTILKMKPHAKNDCLQADTWSARAIGKTDSDPGLLNYPHCGGSEMITTFLGGGGGLLSKGEPMKR